MWANSIVGHPPLIRGVGPSKNWPKILPEKDDNPEKRGEIATFLLLYSSIAFTLSVCVCVCVCVCVSGGGWGGGGGVKFPLLHFGSAVFWVNIQDSHPSFCSIKTWYYLYISDPFWYFTENVNCFIPAFFSSYFWSKCVKFLLTYNLRSITKQNWREIHLKILKQCYNIL